MADLYEIILGRKLTDKKDKIKDNKVVIKTDKTKYKLKPYIVDDKVNNNNIIKDNVVIDNDNKNANNDNEKKMLRPKIIVIITISFVAFFKNSVLSFSFS